MLKVIMEIYMDILAMVLSAVIAGLTTYIAGFLLMKKMKNDVKQEIFDFLGSKEGLQMLADVGKVFVASALSMVGSSPRTKYMNIFGFKVPSEVVMQLISPYLPKPPQGLQEAKQLIPELTQPQT